MGKCAVYLNGEYMFFLIIIFAYRNGWEANKIERHIIAIMPYRMMMKGFWGLKLSILLLTKSYSENEIHSTEI